jgi:hypothetical protein
MNNTFQRSKGQGHPGSHYCHTLSNAGVSNIVWMLMSRSVTGRQLPIRIHQHFVQRLHLVWHRPTRTNHCVERVFFMVANVLAFCHQLTRGGTENLCTCVLCSCVSEELLQFFEVKYDHCPILPPSDSELGTVGAPISWRKCVQESKHTPSCTCNVKSLHCLDWD